MSYYSQTDLLGKQPKDTYTSLVNYISTGTGSVYTDGRGNEIFLLGDNTKIIQSSITSSMSVASSSYVPFGSIIVVHKDGSHTNYFAASDNNISRGNSLLTASTNASDGDILYVSPHTYDIQNNAIDLTLNHSGSISIHGSGKYNTIISSSVSLNCVVIPANNSETTDLTIVVTTNNTVGAWGTFSGIPFVNATVRNVYMSCRSDGILIACPTGSISASVFNTTINSLWDCVNLESNGILDLYDCYMSSNAITVTGSNIGPTARGLVCSTYLAEIRAHNCEISAQGGTLLNAAVHSNTFNPMNLYPGGGSTIYLSGCKYFL